MKTRTVLLVLLLGVLFVYVWQLDRLTTRVEFGVNFSVAHATWLGLNWRETYSAILTDLSPASMRIAAPWDDTERVRGQYDFADLDWQIAEAEKHGTKLTVVVGQKAPRWPECHVPDWSESLSPTDRKAALLAYVRAVVTRYATSPTIEYWQVENEPYIRFAFGNCAKFDASLTTDEIALVRTLAPNKKIMVTDSGELGTWYRASRAGDVLGTTLYRVVRLWNNRVFTYDWLLPSYYRLKAELLAHGVDNLLIAELQAEPWFTGNSPADTPIAEQEETMNPARLRSTLDYVTHIGVHRAYLWGPEWWYWMKTVKNDSRYWDIAKTALKR